jgi:hypothetical protein
MTPVSTPWDGEISAPERSCEATDMKTEVSCMKMVYWSDLEEEMAFAQRAAKHFAEHPEHSSFGDLKPGSFLALRWGIGNDCVVILKLDEHFEPTNYQQLIRKFQRDTP